MGTRGLEAPGGSNASADDLHNQLPYVIYVCVGFWGSDGEPGSFLGAGHDVHTLHGRAGSALAQIVESGVEHNALVVSRDDDLCAVVTGKLVCADEALKGVHLSRRVYIITVQFLYYPYLLTQYLQSDHQSFHKHQLYDSIPPLP